MNPELREQLGKKGYEAAMQHLKRGELGIWEEEEEWIRELYRIEAEAVARELVAQMLPSVQGIITGLHRWMMGEEAQ